jgi:nucleotide-binding universal stress UspA family protein
MMPSPHTRRFRLILAGVDFSGPSAKALRYAVAVARVSGARVVAVHAIDPLLPAAASRAYAKGALIQEIRADLEKFVRSAVGAREAARMKCLVAVGPPREALIAESRRLRPDVVVIGTHGRGGVAKMFFGSVAEALLRRYQGTVMTVPTGVGNPDASWPRPSVLAAVDLAASAGGRTRGANAQRRAMIAASARMAEILGAWVSVVEPAAAIGRPRPRKAELVLLPLPRADRFRAFRQGTLAYEFIRAARRPVLVMHTGSRIGHAAIAPRAA